MFSVYYFDDSYINSIEPKLFATFGTILIIISNNKNSYLTNILKNKAFKAIGLSSFSIYLFHQPIFAFMTIYFTQINWVNTSRGQHSTQPASDKWRCSRCKTLIYHSFFNTYLSLFASGAHTSVKDSRLPASKIATTK